MYCIYCGKKIPSQSDFCIHCGKKQIIVKDNYSNYYSAKSYILTLNELNFYKVLIEIAKELNLLLLCQVSLYSIIETKHKNDKYFNKIRSKSIDFVLVRESDCRIKLCIELDDRTHNFKNRKERDKFINELFRDLHINLLRIKSDKIYDKKELKNIISLQIGTFDKNDLPNPFIKYKTNKTEIIS